MTSVMPFPALTVRFHVELRQVSRFAPMLQAAVCVASSIKSRGLIYGDRNHTLAETGLGGGDGVDRLWREHFSVRAQGARFVGGEGDRIHAGSGQSVRAAARFSRNQPVETHSRAARHRSPRA